MKKKNTLPLILVLGLPIILVVSNFIARLHINVLETPLYLSAVIYPLTYLCTCLIIKKTSSKQAVYLMALALGAQSLSCVVQWIMLGDVDCSATLSTFISFLLGQLIIIVGYDYLKKVKQDNYFSILAIILLVSVLDNLIYGTIIEGLTISLTFLVRLIYVVVIPLVIANDNKKTKK